MISIIIPTCKLEHIQLCIESIYNYTWMGYHTNIKIVVVANGATQECREYLESQSPHGVETLWFDEKIGYTRAINEGLKATGKDDVILLNDDIVLMPQKKGTWIEMLEAPFKEDSKTGVAGPMLCTTNFGKDFLIFFCVMIPRKVIDDVGLLDEIFSPGFCEDVDWCVKAGNKGWKIVQVPLGRPTTPDEKQKGFVKGAFPIWHKGHQTFNEEKDGKRVYTEVFKRNLDLIQKRYNPKYIPDAETVEDMNRFEKDASELLKGRDAIKVVSGLLKHDEEQRIGKKKESIMKHDKYEMRVENPITGWMADGEMATLKELAKGKKRILELGSWFGKSTMMLADSCDGVVYAVDAWMSSASSTWGNGDWDKRQFCMNLMKHIINGKVVPFKMHTDNALTMFIETGVKFDMIFVDADHTKEGCGSDITLAKMCLAEGGLLCGHDFDYSDRVPKDKGGDFPGVKQAVCELVPKFKVKDTIWIEEKCNESLIIVNKKLKITDCCIFYNELELLDIRLNELNDIVDEFIIIESDVTHAGKPKKLNLDMKRYAKFMHKIKYVVPENMPTSNFSWDRERYQRDYAKHLVSHDTDIVITTDVDEIPNKETILKYRPEMGLRYLDMKLYYYWLNCYVSQWDQAMIIGYKDYMKMTPVQIRYSHPPKIENGGWHFSFQGGVDRIIEKLQAYAHSEYSKPEFCNKAWIEPAINTPIDILKRAGTTMKFVPIDMTYPKWLIENLDKYMNWVKLIKGI